jgi:hypothetical protein
MKSVLKNEIQPRLHAKPQASSSSDWQARSLNEKGRVVYRKCSSRDTVPTTMSKPRESLAIAKNKDNRNIPVGIF